ncbi:MAG: amidohydrolase family protein [Balneolaceae bacterium]
MSLDSLSIYRDIAKVDGHLHLNTDRPAMLIEAAQEGFSLITINTEVPFFPDLKQQEEFALNQDHPHDKRIDFISTFSTNNWGETGWQDEAISQIETALNRGAVGVKIWKNVGMELKDKNGSFIMADHPSFDPIYDFLEKHDIPLLAHLGEPKNCWLPIDEMTVTSDIDYFRNHPQYHMYLHPDFPSYKQQLDARDHVLEKHQRLTFVGAHIASLEWSVDKVSQWLDTYPKSAVDLAERVCHLQHQASENPQKVRDFVIKYQDRIIYGTDQIDDGTRPEQDLREELRLKWHNEFRFFSNSDEQTAWNVKKPFLGLGLSRKVLEKIFYHNALKYYPKIKP